MKSFILIDGAAVWVVLAIFVIMFFMIIALGNGYFAKAQKLDKLERRIKRLIAENETLIYKSTFAVPGVGEVRKNEK